MSTKIKILSEAIIKRMNEEEEGLADPSQLTIQLDIFSILYMDDKLVIYASFPNWDGDRIRDETPHDQPTIKVTLLLKKGDAKKEEKDIPFSLSELKLEDLKKNPIRTIGSALEDYIFYHDVFDYQLTHPLSRDPDEHLTFPEQRNLEGKLETMIEPDKIQEIYLTIQSQLEKDGVFQIYDSKGNLLVGAKTRLEALQELEKRINDGTASFVGDSLSLISLKPKSEGLEAHAELLTVLSNLDIKKEGDRKVLYHLKDLVQRGFKSGDLKKISETLLGQKFRDLSGHMKGRQSTSLRGKVKVYSLDDIKALRKFAKKGF